MAAGMIRREKNTVRNRDTEPRLIEPSGYISIVQCRENNRRALQETQDQRKIANPSNAPRPPQGLRDAVATDKIRNKKMKKERIVQVFSIGVLELTPLLSTAGTLF